MMNGRVVASERPGHSILEGAHIVMQNTSNILFMRSQFPTHSELLLFCLHSTSLWLFTAGASVPAFPAYTSSPARDRNLALSFAAGNATLWKPAPSTPLRSIAVTKIVAEVLEKNGIPGAAAGLVIGGICSFVT